jgi:hypothetical protein
MATSHYLLELRPHQKGTKGEAFLVSKGGNMAKTLASPSGGSGYNSACPTMSNMQNREKLAAKVLSAAEVVTPNLDPLSPIIEFSSTLANSLSPQDSPSLSAVLTDDSTIEKAMIDDCIIELSIQLSQVKNKRICKFSPYEYLRHLSVLRFLEWTHERGKSEEEASVEIADMLWAHKDKNGPKQNPRSSLLRKARHIQEWAKEYLDTGELEEHKHGTHKKTESPLARREVMDAANDALIKMLKPTPAALQTELVKQIFPRLQIENPKVSETTCRAYMQQWGWTRGAYKQHWIYNNARPERILKYPDDAAQESEETSVLQSPTTPTPSKRPIPWHAPIPSPTSAIRSTAMADPPILTELVPQSTPQVPQAPMIPPSEIHLETNPSDPSRSSIFWPEMQSYATQQASSYVLPVPERSLDPVSYENPAAARFINAPSPYIPKSLDRLVPDPPNMMGIRPRFNGEPVTTFVPHPSMMQQFMHGSTFPGNTFPSPSINRRHSTENPSTPGAPFNPSSQYSYMPGME